MNNNERVLVVCAVRDELTGRFLNPQYFEKTEEAIRWFKFVLNDTPMWRANAAMYSLYDLGIFGEKSGYTSKTPEMIQGGQSVLERSDNG